MIQYMMSERNSNTQLFSNVFGLPPHEKLLDHISVLRN